MAGEANAFEIRRELARCVPTLLSCHAALPTHKDLDRELDFIDAAAQRGYFLPDEEEVVVQRYSQYMAVRAALVEVLEQMRRHAGRTSSAWSKWPQRLPVFITAFAAGCLRHRCAHQLISLASERPVLWEKLDEENPRVVLARKSFTLIYKEYSRARNLTRLLVAIEFYRRHRDEIQKLADDPQVGPVVRLLRREEPWMDLNKREALKRCFAYRWFSFWRRNRSAWKKVTFGIFEVGGRAVAEIHLPGVKALGAPKRLGRELQEQLLEILQPGDVIVTRHDDALSNLFLPGYWPHAALFIGQPDGMGELEAAQRSGELADGRGRAMGPLFAESKKDGVRVRPAAETLAVDELLVLRSNLAEEEREIAIAKALEHTGKGYDFLFDFRSSERLVCTELIYRSYHGIGPIRFELREVGGRLCLPAEEFLDQAMGRGFELVAAAGLLGGGVMEGEAALRAFEQVSRPLRPVAGEAPVGAVQTAS